jgi:hypothetical protein
MDYGRVLSRAWEITWRWKVLWILGFLASLGRAWGTSSNTSYTTDSSDWGGFSGFQIPPEVIGALVGLTCLGLIIVIAVWVISVMARGGLIAGVQQVEDEGDTSFLRAWRVGRDRFWTLFGIGILAAIPFLILLILGMVLFGIGIYAAVQADAGISEPAGVFAMVAPLLCCGGALCCGMIILGLILDQIRVYAERAAILEGMDWIDAFKRGWQVLKDNLGPTIILWLIFLAIGFVFAFFIIAAMMVLFLPFFAIVANTESALWLLAPICCGGLLSMIVFALIGAVVETFTSATWTLAYRELTGIGGQPALELTAEQ